jgi:hypothetical protein
MRDCLRDPYVTCIWRNAWPIPMKPPVTPGHWPSKSALRLEPSGSAGGICYVRKCSQVDRPHWLRLAGLDMTRQH